MTVAIRTEAVNCGYSLMSQGILFVWKAITLLEYFISYRVNHSCVDFQHLQVDGINTQFSHIGGLCHPPEPVE